MRPDHCYFSVPNAMPGDLIYVDDPRREWSTCLNMKTLDSSITHKFQGDSVLLLNGVNDNIGWKKEVNTDGDNIFCTVVFEDDNSDINFLVHSDKTGTYQF